MPRRSHGVCEVVGPGRGLASSSIHLIQETIALACRIFAQRSPQSIPLLSITPGAPYTVAQSHHRH